MGAATKDAGARGDSKSPKQRKNPASKAGKSVNSSSCTYPFPFVAFVTRHLNWSFRVDHCRNPIVVIVACPYSSLLTVRHPTSRKAQRKTHTADHSQTPLPKATQ